MNDKEIIKEANKKIIELKEEIRQKQKLIEMFKATKKEAIRRILED